MPLRFNKPGRQLQTCWLEWIAKYEELKSKGFSTAAPFFSAAPTKRQDPLVLFVGKATNGVWKLDEFGLALQKSPREAVAAMLQQNRDFVEQYVGQRRYSTSFWHLFKNVGLTTNSIIWSNVLKIGSTRGNPGARLRGEQADLAARTLRAEVREYEPSLVLFVTANYADNIVNDAFGFTKKGWHHSRKGAADEEVWWLSGTSEFPGVRFLWTRHPQGKSALKLKLWRKKAQELLAN